MTTSAKHQLEKPFTLATARELSPFSSLGTLNNGDRLLLSRPISTNKQSFLFESRDGAQATTIITTLKLPETGYKIPAEIDHLRRIIEICDAHLRQVEKLPVHQMACTLNLIQSKLNKGCMLPRTLHAPHADIDLKALAGKKHPQQWVFTVADTLPTLFYKETFPFEDGNLPFIPLPSLRQKFDQHAQYIARNHRPYRSDRFEIVQFHPATIHSAQPAQQDNTPRTLFRLCFEPVINDAQQENLQNLWTANPGPEA